MSVAKTAFAGVLAVCTLTLCAPLVVQSSTATPTPEVPSPTSVPPAGLSSESPSDSEAALLRAQLDVMRRYDERLLQTVYWALGTAFALVLFAAGAGWYVNFRLYERDTQALRRELRSEVETRSDTIGRSLEQDMQEARTSLDDAIKKLTVDLHEHADRRSKEIEKAALQAGKEAADSLRARFETMQIEITNTRYDMLIRDAEKWRQQGVHVNELREYMRALSLAVQLTESVGAYEWLIEKALEGMQGALEAGARLGVGDVTKMTELIDALPSKYSIQADRLRGLVSPSTG